MTSWEKAIERGSEATGRGLEEPESPAVTPKAGDEGQHVQADQESQEIVDPSTGELVLLETRTSDLLADLVLELKERVKNYTAWRKAAERELLHRVKDKGRSILETERFELRDKRSARREWDAETLEAVLRDLIDQGHLQPREVLGVVVHETRVSGTAALKLIGRLAPDSYAREQIEGCVRWAESHALEITPTPDIERQMLDSIDQPRLRD